MTHILQISFDTGAWGKEVRGIEGVWDRKVRGKGREQ